MSIVDPAPQRAEARATDRGGRAACGACGGYLAHKDLWRCPWVACRKWLRGLADAPTQLDTQHRSAA
jgi:hypothetical protein